MNQSLPKIPNTKVLCLTIGIPEESLTELLANIETYYYQKEEQKLDQEGLPILNKEGIPKVRILNPSTGLLKKVQSKIKNRILAKVQMPNNIRGGVRGQDNIKNARYHVGNKFKFATDLKDFFPSISEIAVFETFIRLGYYPKVSEVLSKLLTYRGKVPQGAPTSTHIANIVFLPIDYKIISFCGDRGIKYTRYIDDLSFSAPYDFLKECSVLIKIIAPHFKISRKKTFYTSGKAKFTGLWVGNNSLDVDEMFKQKMQAETTDIKGQSSPRAHYYKRVKNAMKNKKA